jgi:predicted NUDIX family phosphoesterase
MCEESKKVTIDDLTEKEKVELLYQLSCKFPIGTEAYDNCLKALQTVSMYSNKKYVLCVKREEIVDTGMFIFADVVKSLGINNGSFMDNKSFTFKPRRELEYNMYYRQVCVGLYITDADGDLILLRTKDKGRIHNKITLLQGHVDFSKECYTMSQQEFLYHNICRELSEEIAIAPTLNNPIPIYKEPILVMVVNDTLVQTEHIGFVYRAHIKGTCKELIKYITSNEPEKHDLVYINRNQIEAFADHFDAWTKRIFLSK